MAVELSIVAQKKQKKRRGERARKRWRPRPYQLDLRDRYREGDLPTGDLAVVSFDDPYEQAAWPDAEGTRDVAARLRQVRHADGSIAQGGPAWEPPRKPRVTAVANLRGDVLGRLWARHQISEPQFLAGRAYQECHDAAAFNRLRSVDLSKTKVSGGQLLDPITERQKRAVAKLRKIEAALKSHNGDVAAWFVRMILGERHSIEAVARLAGAATRDAVRGQVWLFKQYLNTIAVAVGLASSTRRPYRPKFIDGEDPGLDPGRAAGDAELVDPALRRGRTSR
jgi:hypothetical protein